MHEDVNKNSAVVIFPYHVYCLSQRMIELKDDKTNKITWVPSKYSD